MHGTTGIVFQKQLGLNSWADLWEPRLAGKMTMLDDPPEVLGACLKKIGASLNTADPALLRASAEQAIAQKRFLRAYLNAEVRDQLVSGDIAVAQAWAVTAGQAIAAKALSAVVVASASQHRAAVRTSWTGHRASL